MKYKKSVDCLTAPANKRTVRKDGFYLINCSVEPVSGVFNEVIFRRGYTDFPNKILRRRFDIINFGQFYHTFIDIL